MPGQNIGMEGLAGKILQNKDFGWADGLSRDEVGEG